MATVQIHAAVTIMAESAKEVLWRPNPKAAGGMEMYVPKLGEDVEVGQFCAEFPTKRITERAFRQAMTELLEQCVARAIKCNIIA